MLSVLFFFSSRRRHTRWTGDWSSDVCSSDLIVRNLHRYAGRILWIVARDHLENERDVFDTPSQRRSEERRVGKDCRSRSAPNQDKNKYKNTVYSIIPTYLSICRQFNPTASFY